MAIRRGYRKLNYRDARRYERYGLRHRQTRRGRGLGDWFKRGWKNVKGFFHKTAADVKNYAMTEGKDMLTKKVKELGNMAMNDLVKPTVSNAIQQLQNIDMQKMMTDKETRKNVVKNIIDSTTKDVKGKSKEILQAVVGDGKSMLQNVGTDVKGIIAKNIEAQKQELMKGEGLKPKRQYRKKGKGLMLD